MGPVGFYSSIGGGRPAGSAQPAGAASTQRRLNQYEKAEEASRLAAAIESILGLHRQEFPPARPPVAPPAPPIDEQDVRGRYERQALSGIGFFKRKERRAAKVTAAASADKEIDAVRVEREVARLAQQAELDKLWAQLTANDPEVVLATLEDAFEDNEAPAAAVNVQGSEVSLVVVAPPEDAIPERMPTTTAAGNLSLKKMAKRDRVGLYNTMVAGYVLTTLREAFAVAPGITSARVVAFRSQGLDSYGKHQAEVVLAGRFARAAFDGIRWDSTEASQILNDTSTELRIHQRGQAQELQPLNLDDEPELAALVAAIDLTEMATR